MAFYRHHISMFAKTIQQEYADGIFNIG